MLGVLRHVVLQIGACQLGFQLVTPHVTKRSLCHEIQLQSNLSPQTEHPLPQPAQRLTPCLSGWVAPQCDTGPTPDHAPPLPPCTLRLLPRLRKIHINGEGEGVKWRAPFGRGNLNLLVDGECSTLSSAIDIVHGA